MNMQDLFGPLESAIYETVNGFVDPMDTKKRGATALAPRIGMVPGTLSNKANPLQDNELTLRESVPVQLAASDFRILYAYNQVLGHAAYRLPANDHVGGYALDRLLRTEMNRAYTESYVATVAQHPDIAGVKFNLSPNHPRTDICDLYASANLHGLGVGVYPAGEHPYPAHPNTLSFLTSVFKDQVSDADPSGICVVNPKLETLRRHHESSAAPIQEPALARQP